MIEKLTHGHLPGGREVALFRLRNARGMEAELSAFGATLVSLTAADRQGNLEPVVLGLDSLEAYLRAETNFGAVVGRYANRIGHGHLEIEGKTYHLALNLNGEVHLHGGHAGFDRFLWESQALEEAGRRGVAFHFLSPHGQENYPGNLEVCVTYWLTDRDSLEIHYQARTDRSTVVNLSNHAYFNLSGNLKKDALEHQLMLNAEYYTPTDAAQLPTGTLAPVAGTPLDFRHPVAIGARIEDPHEQMRLGSGYDHNFVIRREGDGLALAAQVSEPESGRKMEVYTTQPGVQLYTANWLDGSYTGMGGKPFYRRCAFCLETQHFPDSPNHLQFPSTLLRPGEVYDHKAVFMFSAW